MSIEPKTASKILRLTRSYWDKNVAGKAFTNLAAGKEIGHRIADAVDERTTELLHTHFDSKYERRANGEKRPRSMGDIWIRSNGIYNPVNVKTGEAGKNGQPNMVSLKKLLANLVFCEIDSYHLLIVKLTMSKPLRCNVYFVDMLNYLEYVTFDSGPGQIMLKERQFFDAMKRGIVPKPLTIEKKVQKVFELLKDGERRLIRNRAAGLVRIERHVAQYVSSRRHKIDQSLLRLG